ncbi:MAG: NAD(P)H-dependent oxidoreductase, partial [Leuconostoc citreum]
MKNFVALVGSESSTSTNRHLLQYMKTHFSAEATIELISLTNLPIFKKTDDRFMPE